LTASAVFGVVAPCRQMYFFNACAIILYLIGCFSLSAGYLFVDFFGTALDYLLCENEQFGQKSIS
jgi:hypothetical protein